MSFPISDVLALISSIKLLLKEEPLILASPEDAAFFRTRQSKTLDVSTPKPSQITPPQKKIEEEKQPVICAPPLSSITIEQKEASVETSKAQPTPLVVEKVNEEILTPVKQLPPRPTSQFRSILEKVAPDLAILDVIPDDSTARQLATRWKTKNQSAPISIISSGELPQHKALLAEIATALDVYYGPARFIEGDILEKEKQWKLFLSVDTLKLIVICDSTLWQLHHLRQFYKETPATGSRMLGEIPIFLLPDLSLYLKDPLLKRSLWKALCTKLS